LGYVVNGNNDAQAKNFLNTHNAPNAWSSISWRAPYHSSDAERNNDLAAADILGTGLIGHPTAEQALATAASNLNKDDAEAARLLAVIEEARKSNAEISRLGMRGYYSKVR
jgi:acetyl-CoA carboxylase alpha subunit